MKKEKIKNRLLKLGILFFGILITFTNCEKEELIANDIQLAKNWFEKERISELDKNPFNTKNINWDKAILNNDGNIFVPIQLDRENNKLALIIDNNLRKDIFYQPYYILTKIDNQNFTYVFKVFFDKNNFSIAEDFNNHLNLPYITYGNQNETLNSSVNFYNKNKELISAKDGCVVIDWFIVTSINGVIISEEYIGSSIDCNSEGLDDGSEGGGGSTTVSMVKPHCSSFEYAKPPGSNYTGCAVTGINNTFYGLTNSGIRQITIVFDIMYFSMPLWMNNGVAATKTAEALDKAFEATENWFANNPSAMTAQVQLHLSNGIISEMGKIGGTASTTTAPFPIQNPSQYITNFFTTGNCN